MYAAAQQTIPLAMSAAGTWAVAIVGIVVVGVLVGAFWWGSRRSARRPVPPQEPQPGANSWHEPDDSETHHSGPRS